MKLSPQLKNWDIIPTDSSRSSDLMMESNLEKVSRRLARDQVILKLQAKRQSMFDAIRQDAWGNRFYSDITKEADSDSPSPSKHPELWTWPSRVSGTEDHRESLGRFFCDLDDDWSGIVKMIFLMLDCYYGANGYLSTYRTQPPNTLPVRFRLVEDRKHLGRVLMDLVDRDGLELLQQQLRSSWLTDLVREIGVTASKLDPEGKYQREDGTFMTEPTSDPVGGILALLGRMLSSLNWWIGELLERDTLYYEGRLISSEAVKDIERMLSQLCRSLGQTRRDEWVDEEKQRAAGHLIIVRAA